MDGVAMGRGSPSFCGCPLFVFLLVILTVSPLDIHATIEEKVRYKMAPLDVLIDNDAAHLKEVFSK